MNDSRSENPKASGMGSEDNLGRIGINVNSRRLDGGQTFAIVV